MATKEKICVQCAQRYENQPWRAACDRCGDHVFYTDDPRAADAKNRAYFSGWTKDAKVKKPDLARRRRDRRGW